jgi:acetolactate synthase-1/2/3 large subunit
MSKARHRLLRCARPWGEGFAKYRNYWRISVAYARSSWSFNNGGVENESLCDSVPPEQHSMVVLARPARDSAQHEETVSLSDALVDTLAALGVTHAFGIIGGGIAPFCEAVRRSPIQLVHFRQEAGAAFAAIEASLASQRLAVVVATTGPGLTNLYTGMVAARREGARVLFVTGCTPAAQRGRGAFQETSFGMGDLANLFTPGALFHHAAVIEDFAELGPTTSRLMTAAARPHGFVAHLGLPISMQTARGPRPLLLGGVTTMPPSTCDEATLNQCAEILSNESWVLWLGHGARHSAAAVRSLVDRTGVRVMCTPRGKGIIPEDTPEFLGVTGLGGHERVVRRLMESPPERILVLGTRMGEFSSFWLPAFAPRRGFIHVDLDPDAFGAAYPDVPTIGIPSDIRSFVEALVPRVTSREPVRRPSLVPAVDVRPRATGPVRPSHLMRAIQKVIVEHSDAIVLTEAGNSFSLGSHHLRSSEAGRYRVSTSFGSMGHAAAGVIGATLGSRQKAVAIVGDGAMLMLNELSTAANYEIDAVWIILNDARYGMIAQGMQAIGWQPFGTDFPRADFVAIARAMGCDGVRVEHETQIEEALRRAMLVSGPFVIDVIIDPDEPGPPNLRNASLVKQGVNGCSKPKPEVDE